MQDEPRGNPSNFDGEICEDMGADAEGYVDNYVPFFAEDVPDLIDRSVNSKNSKLADTLIKLFMANPQGRGMPIDTTNPKLEAWLKRDVGIDSFAEIDINAVAGAINRRFAKSKVINSKAVIRNKTTLWLVRSSIIQGGDDATAGN